jgi:hypothetical protein
MKRVESQGSWEEQQILKDLETSTMDRKVGMQTEYKNAGGGQCMEQ